MKEIPGAPGYFASETGTIIGKKGRPLRTTINPVSGYEQVRIPMFSKPRTFTVHRLVALAYHGPKPSKKHCVCHNDGNKLNNSASNLRWDTFSKNNFDMQKHGTARIGSKNPMSSLTEEQVAKLRSIPRSTWSDRAAAGELGVAVMTVWRARAKHTWKHI